jgi:hypothetical protein
MSDDFNVLSQKDRQDMSYAACIGGSVLIGAAVGSMLALPGMLAGAAEGLAVGLLTCRRLSPAIERKLFSRTERFSERELTTVLKAVRDQTGASSKSDAMYLLRHVRIVALAEGETLLKEENACMPTRLAASKLLAQRA